MAPAAGSEWMKMTVAASLGSGLQSSVAYFSAEAEEGLPLFWRSAYYDPAQLLELALRLLRAAGIWNPQAQESHLTAAARARWGSVAHVVDRLGGVGERCRNYDWKASQFCYQVSDLLGHFEEAYAAPDFSPQQLKEEYNTHFRPQAASQAWEELSPRGFARLLADERLTSSSAVMDVGSGLGKLVAVAAATTPVSAAWGIELSPRRAEAAVEARRKLEARGALSSVEVERMRLLQGNCLEDLSEEALSASHFVLTMRRVGKLPAGTRQVAERFLDLLARRGDAKVVWSVGKRLEPRPGLEYVHSCMLDAEWTDQEDVLIHRYSLA
ncbi:unnamed protein product [Symbiodinium sp. CCMP2592]|nr:unnamed protein product [Symbiodinium sp. CCMP2592]